MKGRHKLSKDEKRSASVRVWLSVKEMSALDSARGPRQRAEHIRLSLAGSVPHAVPAINIKTASDLGRSLGSLSALAAASRKGGFIQERDLLPILIELRNLLLVGKTQLTNESSE